MGIGLVDWISWNDSFILLVKYIKTTFLKNTLISEIFIFPSIQHGERGFALFVLKVAALGPIMRLCIPFSTIYWNKCA